MLILFRQSSSNCCNLPYQPSFFEHFTSFLWVLPNYYYVNQAGLLQFLKEHVIDPAERKAQELTKR